MVNKKDKKGQASLATINVIGEGTTINGDLTANGDLRIDGVVNGNVQSSSKCILGASGHVKGNIEAANCDINGKVVGDVRIKDLLLIKSTGVIAGDIRTSKIVLENGAEFNGSCTMGSSVSMQKGSTSEDVAQATA